MEACGRDSCSWPLSTRTHPNPAIEQSLADAVPVPSADEQQHAIDQRSRAGKAAVEVRPEVAGTIDFVLSDQRNEPAKCYGGSKTSRIIHGNR